MRIIGGSFKGTKIFEAFDKNTRPLRDLVKESILNILEYWINAILLVSFLYIVLFISFILSYLSVCYLYVVLLKNNKKVIKNNLL